MLGEKGDDITCVENGSSTVLALFNVSDGAVISPELTTSTFEWCTSEHVTLQSLLLVLHKHLVKG
jgi:hypothetical protein